MYSYCKDRFESTCFHINFVTKLQYIEIMHSVVFIICSFDTPISKTKSTQPKNSLKLEFSEMTRSYTSVVATTISPKTNTIQVTTRKIQHGTTPYLSSSTNLFPQCQQSFYNCIKSKHTGKCLIEVNFGKRFL